MKTTMEVIKYLYGSSPATKSTVLQILGLFETDRVQSVGTIEHRLAVPTSKEVISLSTTMKLLIEFIGEE